MNDEMTLHKVHHQKASGAEVEHSVKKCLQTHPACLACWVKCILLYSNSTTHLLNFNLLIFKEFRRLLEQIRMAQVNPEQ